MGATEIRELSLYIPNNEPLYRQAQSIIENLAKKIVKGTYDETLALKAWQNLADRGAAQYDREFGSNGGSMKWISKSDRTEVAKQLQEYFQDELDEKVESLKSDKKSSLSVKASIDILSGRNKKAEEEVDERAEALLNYLKDNRDVDEDLTVEDVQYNGLNEYTVDGMTYLVLTYDEAEKAARDDIESLYDDMGLEAFSEGFQWEIEHNMIDDDAIESLMEDYISEDVDNMDDEEVKEQCISYGLIEDPDEMSDEMSDKLQDYLDSMSPEEVMELGVETGWCDEDEETYTGDELEELKDNLAREFRTMDYSELVEYCEKYNLIDTPEGEVIPSELLKEYLVKIHSSDPVEYFKELYYGDDFGKFLMDNNLISIDKIADACIDVDGIAHFIARYDGRELELDNDFYAYRVD